VASWSVLTGRARLLLCMARDPGARLRDSRPARAAPSAAPTASSPTWPSRLRGEAERRPRYQIQAHLPPPEPASQEPAIGGVLALLAGAGARLQL